jgi:acyl carrier protein
MNITDFIEKFAEAAEVENVSSLSAETKFRDLNEWSSLASLSIIAMVDEEFEVTLNGNDIRSSNTIQDLYNLIAKKQG